MNIDLSTYILREVWLKNNQILVLRRPIIEDAERIIEYLNLVGGESDNLLFGKDEFHLSIDQEKECIKNISNDTNALMIIGTIESTIASIAQISSPSRQRIAHNSDLCISVKKEYWGKGIGTAVMEELIKCAKENNTVKNISLGVKASNKHAITMYKKFGFEQIGYHKNYFNINGEFDDELLMDFIINRVT